MPTAWQAATAYLRAPLNSFEFAVRSRVAWRRGPPALPHESKAELYGFLPARARWAAELRESELLRRYALAPLRARSTRHVYRENVALLAALEDVLGRPPLPAGETLRAVDVGAKNWSYVYALSQFLGSRGPLELHGVEVDAHARYADLRTREDYAQAYMDACPRGALRFWAQDALDFGQPGGFDVVTCFYPFLTRYALLRWGCPLSLFQPEALIAHLVTLLRPGGTLCVFTQTSDERARLLELLPAGAVAAPLRGRWVPGWRRHQDRWGVTYVAPAGQRATPPSLSQGWT